MQKPEMLSDPRFGNVRSRVENREVTDRAVADAFASLAHDELIERLTKAEIAFAEVNDVAALSRHPHLRRITIGVPGGSISYAAPAMIVMGAPRSYGPVPAVGEHTEAVLGKKPR